MAATNPKSLRLLVNGQIRSVNLKDITGLSRIQKTFEDYTHAFTLASGEEALGTHDQASTYNRWMRQNQPAASTDSPALYPD